MAATVTIWSDVHCPWASVAVHRLRRARDEHDVDVVFDPRPWPLEWVNERGTPRTIVGTEAVVLAAHEPELFSRFRGDSWPSTFLPAFELIAAARLVHGVRAAEEVDYQLRVAFFRASRDVSVRHHLRAALEEAADADPGGIDADAVMTAYDADPVRAQVVADYRRSRELPIEGSPQIFWPDGETTHNPGMTDVRWERGIPRIGHADPDAADRMLRAHVASSSASGRPHDVASSSASGGRSPSS